MSGHAKRKSRGSERSSSKHKKKKSHKRSSSSSSDCVIVTSDRNSSGKVKKRKSHKKKHRRNSSSSSSSSDSCIGRLKLDSKPHQLLGKRPEFCRNGSSLRANNALGQNLQRNQQLSAQESRRTGGDKPADMRERFAVLERRVKAGPMNTNERGRKRAVKDRLGGPPSAKKSKKSRKRRRSSSRSSSSSWSTSSRSSSSSSTSSRSSSSSSNSSYERRKIRKKKKKLAKKMKSAEKKRREDKKKLKRMKARAKEPIKEMKHSIDRAAQDRLMKDINEELADRARAMAPMTREQWEKKQSVIRRVYDGETGRHRLIKGDGEVLEEIVSRDRHMQINKQATKGDGEFFQARLSVNK